MGKSLNTTPCDLAIAFLKKRFQVTSFSGITSLLGGATMLDRGQQRDPPPWGGERQILYFPCFGTGNPYCCRTPIQG